MAILVSNSKHPVLGTAGRLEVRLDARTRAVFYTRPVASGRSFDLFAAIVPAQPEKRRGNGLFEPARPRRVFHLLRKTNREGQVHWLVAEGDLPMNQSLRRPSREWNVCHPKAILPALAAA